jgi:hypothetical protein
MSTRRAALLIVPAALAAAITIAASAQQPSPPANRSLPAIVGSFFVGDVVRARNGDWAGTPPLTFTYQWLRCGRFGGNCRDLPGATSRSYRLTPADARRTLRIRVAAANAAGSSSAISRPSPVVRRRAAPPSPPPPSGPPGQVRLADGSISIPVTSVSPPHRLVISGVSFSPNPVRSRTPFTGRLRVTDTRGYVVRGATVFVLGVPYERIEVAPEQVTEMDGSVTFTLRPTASLPLRRGFYLVMFLRARKPGDSLLAGVSTRRLVQVRLGPPS